MKVDLPVEIPPVTPIVGMLERSTDELDRIEQYGTEAVSSVTLYNPANPVL